MSERTISHFTMDGINPATATICGEIIEDAVDARELPVCVKCATLMMEAYIDACDRIVAIAEALALKDSLGQKNLIHHETNDRLDAIFWTPGPLRPEGPRLEDGSF